jgi:hypothetical protein
MIEQDKNRRNQHEPQAEKLMPSKENEELVRFPDTGDRGDRPKEPYGLREGGETALGAHSTDGVNPSGAEPPEEAFLDEKLQRSRTL